MIGRNEHGNLKADRLELSDFFDELFNICKTEHEVEWVHRQLEMSLEYAMQEKLEELEAAES